MTPEEQSTREIAQEAQRERWMFGGWPWTVLEDVSIAKREDLERRYHKNPARMHAYLVYSGRWMIAAQLRIDEQVGRLAEPLKKKEDENATSGTR